MRGPQLSFIPPYLTQAYGPLIVLPFLVSSLMERYPSAFMMLVFASALAGISLGVGASQRVGEDALPSRGRRIRLVAMGLASLVASFAGGAIEGIRDLPVGSSLWWMMDFKADDWLRILSVAQWAIPTGYAVMWLIEAQRAIILWRRA